MSKVLLATCDATGKVTVEGKVIDAAVLSEGTKASSGVVILEAGVAYYVASSATDIKALIESVVAIIQKLVEITTSLDAVTTSPGTAAANIALLTTLKTQLDLTKDQLK